MKRRATQAELTRAYAAQGNKDDLDAMVNMRAPVDAQFMADLARIEEAKAHGTWHEKLPQNMSAVRAARYRELWLEAMEMAHEMGADINAPTVREQCHEIAREWWLDGTRGRTP